MLLDEAISCIASSAYGFDIMTLLKAGLFVLLFIVRVDTAFSRFKGGTTEGGLPRFVAVPAVFEALW